MIETIGLVLILLVIALLRFQGSWRKRELIVLTGLVTLVGSAVLVTIANSFYPLPCVPTIVNLILALTVVGIADVVFQYVK